RGAKRRQTRGRLVPRAVVDEDDFEGRRPDLSREGNDHRKKVFGASVRRDDDREANAPTSKISSRVVWMRPGAPSRNGAKKSDASRSSPGYVGTIRRGNFAKISASPRRLPACTTRRFSESAAW